MKNRKNSRDDEHSPEERKRKLNLKKKKQRNTERTFRLTNMVDFDEFDEEHYI